MGKYLKCLKESKDLTEEEKIKSLDEVLKEIVNLNISVKYIYTSKGSNFYRFGREKLSS